MQIEYKGREQSWDEWAKELGVKKRTLQARYYSGMSSDLVFKPGSLVSRGVRSRCGVLDCKKHEYVIGTGLCAAHARRERLYGNPLGGHRAITSEPEYATWEYIVYSSGKDFDPRWKDYEIFREDMGAKGAGQVLCRKDWEEPFSAQNCFWGSRAQSRHAQIFVWNGQEKTLREWSTELGISVVTLKNRLNAGWDLDKVFKK